jgi:hypothetical protein
VIASVRALLRQVRKLNEALKAYQPCDQATMQPTVILVQLPGRPSPEVPLDARRCPRCGEVHPLLFKIEVVEPKQDGTAANLRPHAEE